MASASLMLSLVQLILTDDMRAGDELYNLAFSCWNAVGESGPRKNSCLCWGFIHYGRYRMGC